MSETKKDVSKIDSLLAKIGLKSVPVKEDVKLEKMKLDDGTTIVEADSFEAGQAIMVIIEDGEPQALPVGEYGMEDGRTIVVQEDGVIFEIKEAGNEGEEEAEAPVAASEEATATPTAPKKVVESVSKESYFSSASEDEIIEFISKAVDLKIQSYMKAKEEVELSEVKTIVHNPEKEVKLNRKVKGKEGITQFLNNK